MHKFLSLFPIQIPLPFHKKCYCWEANIFFPGKRKETAWPPSWLTLPDLSLTLLQFYTHYTEKQGHLPKQAHLNNVLEEDDGEEKHYLLHFNIFF